MERIHGRDQARDLLRKDEAEQKAISAQPVKHASDVQALQPQVDPQAPLPPLPDGIDINPDEVQSAKDTLASVTLEIAACLQQAKDLGGPLGDGQGPVARHMREAFGLRGGDQGGSVQKALNEYLTELNGLVDAVAGAAATHATADAANAAAIQAAGADAQNGTAI